MIVKYSPFAELDLTESINFYKEKNDNLSEEFFDIILETVERIQSNPLQFPFYHKTIRKAVTSRFPFNIFFR